MWFRGVAASMGLYFNLGAVFEGHPDILFAVNGDVVHRTFNKERPKNLPTSM